MLNDSPQARAQGSINCWGVGFRLVKLNIDILEPLTLVLWGKPQCKGGISRKKSFKGSAKMTDLQAESTIDKIFYKGDLENHKQTNIYILYINLFGIF